MPFGLDLKSIIFGALFVMFIWPWIAGMFNKNKPAAAAA